MSLYDAIDELIETYNSIDVRTFCALQNNSWNNIFTIIRFRREKIDELKKNHERIVEMFGDLIDTDEFRVGMFQLPIERWGKMKADLSSRSMCLGDDFGVNFSSAIGLDRPIVHPYSSSDMESVFADWNVFHHYAEEDSNAVFGYRHKLGDKAVKNGFGDIDDYLSAIFESAKYGSQKRPRVDIFVPVFVRVGRVRFDFDRADVPVSTYRQENLEVTFNFLGSRRGPKSQPVAKKTASMPTGDGEELQEITVPVQLETSNLNEFELLVIKNRKIVLAKERNSISRLWDGRNEFTHPYSAVFAKYAGIDELERMLLEFKSRDGGQSKTFETAVSWLLSLLNLPNIQLGKYEKIGSGTEEVSTDVISSVDKNTILLANATTGLPRQSDFDRERGFRENLTKLMKNKDVEFMSVYFTARDATESLQAASSNGVSLIGRTQLRQILLHLREGETKRAREVILKGRFS